MKKITCIQQYVIDNLIEDEILSTDSFLVQTYLNWSVMKTQEIKQTQ